VNQKVILLQLKKLGYEANAVTNGLDAVERVQKTPYDVVLMDCHMPEMNGYEATQAIRQIAGRAQLIKIIAVTANADPEERKKCLDAGMDDYLIKPIKIEKLSQVLSEIANAVGAAQGVASVSDEESIAAGLKSFGDVDVIMELIDLFLEDAPEKILEARQSINSEDYNGIRDAAHSLKGSARNLRAESLADVCELLEQSAKKEFKMPAAEHNLNRVEEELKKVIHVLNNKKRDLAG
jgi:CheY-like chemotaxis protein